MNENVIPLVKEETCLMIDVESLGKNLRAPLLSIAAVPFTMSGKVFAPFHCNINPFDGAWEKAFYIDGETLIWWLNQNEHARKALQDPAPMPLPAAIYQFEMFFETVKPAKVWARGPQFDLRLIEFASKICCSLNEREEHSHMQFDWYNVRDERSYTLELPHEFPVQWPELGAQEFVKHHPVSDCMWSIARVLHQHRLMETYLANQADWDAVLTP